jgi:hypothetical protein
MDHGMSAMIGCFDSKKKNSPQRHRVHRESKNKSVIPAKAGIHLADNALVDGWIPAFAGMTIFRTDRREAAGPAMRLFVES